MLDIKKISKTFNPGTVNEKKALTELSLHLDEGDFVTIVGSNGAGKSTLFNAIAGSFYVDEGSISLAGEVLDIDGDCGGYNLQWAWSSGYLAGLLKSGT